MKLFVKPVSHEEAIRNAARMGLSPEPISDVFLADVVKGVTKLSKKIANLVARHDH